MPKNIAQNRRTHAELRHHILKSLQDSKKSIHEISTDSGINWKTVELHLTFLKGKEYVAEVFRHHQLRIFEITKLGFNDLKIENDKKRYNI